MCDGMIHCCCVNKSDDFLRTHLRTGGRRMRTAQRMRLAVMPGARWSTMRPIYLLELTRPRSMGTG